jgi:hypothetical protein
MPRIHLVNPSTQSFGMAAERADLARHAERRLGPLLWLASCLGARSRVAESCFSETHADLKIPGELEPTFN